MLGDTKQTKGIFLNLKEGSIVCRQDGTETHHSFVEGAVVKINLTEREFSGEKVKYWYIHLRDLTTNELYLLGLHYNSGAFKSIVLQLASESGLTALRSQKPIKIEVYAKDGHTKVRCFSGDVKLSWVTRDLPPTQDVRVGNNVVKDDSARMKFIEEYVGKLQDILSFMNCESRW